MANKFFTKKCELIVLEELSTKLDTLEHDRRFKWDTLGTQHQAKDWRTGELLWEDEKRTIPKMVDDWGELDKAPEDYTDEDQGVLAAIEKLRSYLLALA